jgi:protein TonB
VLLAGAVVSLPLLMDAPLPEVVDGVRIFFATPLELAPPPPPPPPPPAQTVKTALKVRTPETAPTNAFVAPIETPAEIVPELGIDFGVEGGVGGGVEGGVPGGVVGGVIGGLPEAPPAPTLEPIRVGGRIQEPRRLKGGPPSYPEAARDARLEGVVILECHINPQGRVAEIVPTLMDGVPVPVLLTVTVRFDLTNRS